MANGDDKKIETKDNTKLKTTSDLANNDKSVIENFSMGGVNSQITTGTNKYGAKVSVLTHKKDGKNVGETYDKAEINKYRNQIASNKKTEEVREFARDVHAANPNRDSSSDKKKKKTLLHTPTNVGGL